MGPPGVAVVLSAVNDVSQVGEPVLVQALGSELVVKALEVGVLDRLPQLTEGELHLTCVRPRVEGAGTSRTQRVDNALASMERYLVHLATLPQPVRIAFEPTGVCHRPLAHRLVAAAFEV